MFLSDLQKGASVFIDANIFIYHFSKESRFNQSCTSFLENVETGFITGFTSMFIVQEVTHRMMVLEAAGLLPGVRHKDIIKHLKRDPHAVRN